MAGTEVSSVIRDILDAFDNSLNILKGRGKRHKRRHSEPSNANEERKVQDSLTLRPQEIKRTYDQSVAKHGHCFEVGDSKSQTSLAQILLVLNNGLIKLLNHALSGDHKSRSQSRYNLLDLSETTAMDTLSALSELNLRLMSTSKLDLRPSAPVKNADNEGRKKTGPRADSCAVYMAKRPAISPNLSNGGWVRSKSSPAVVSVIAPMRTGRSDQHRGSTSRSASAAPAKSTSSIAMSKTSGTRSPPLRYSQLAKEPPTLRPKPEHLQARLARLPKHEEEPEIPQSVRRQPSMYIVPGDFFDIFPSPSLPRYEPQTITAAIVPISARPPRVPHHSRPQQHQAPIDGVDDNVVPAMQPDSNMRHRPTSMMTFATASTKIGEIPEHRLPDRELSEQQQKMVPMPYVVPDMLYPQKKKESRGLKFWKRQERSALVGVGA